MSTKLGSELSRQQRTGDENVIEGDLILNRAGCFVATENEKNVNNNMSETEKKIATDWAGRKRTTHALIQVIKDRGKL